MFNYFNMEYYFVVVFYFYDVQGGGDREVRL